MVMVPRIATVSYLNTIPFVYGIQHEGSLRAELLLSPPSECAANFISGKADIALVPSAVVPTLVDAEIITNYCIGASGPVRTVVLAGNAPIGMARRVFLDSHSLTSVQLAKHLLAEYWKQDVEFLPLDDLSQIENSQIDDFYLLIGDKVFDYESEFEYIYDLAEVWEEHTQLPFAFAVWVARKGTDPAIIDSLEKALTYGVEHTYEAILEHGYDTKPYDSYSYLTQNIDYIFDNQKHKALKKFWDAGLRITPRSNPG